MPQNTSSTGLIKALLVFFILVFGVCLSVAGVSGIPFFGLLLGLDFFFFSFFPTEGRPM